jgi:glycosyltransferase involved in cell wall biosynthesis
MISFDKKVDWIWWGLDKGKSNLAFYVKLLLSKRKNPIVFYHEEIKRKFMKNGIPQQLCYVANNTFHVANHKSLANEISKNSFINVGSLDLRKENDVLIKAFKEVLNRCGSDLNLYFIGDGVDRYRLEELVVKLELTEHVYFEGRITDSAELKKYYARALASVSFGQAGLSVLQSMGYGVPFITTADAISGGEKFNVIDGYNGVTCNHDLTSLVDVMTKLAEDPIYASSLGENAYAHYKNKATLEIMVDGFRSAIGHTKV